MRFLRRCGALAAVLCVLTLNAVAVRRPETPNAWILTKEGQSVEGDIKTSGLQVTVDGKSREILLHDVLSIQTASPASSQETKRIADGLAAINANTDRAGRDDAVADLTDIGLPVMSPLLAMYKDTDMHEPYPLYRLFARIMPGYADRGERNLDLIRLANGEALRGTVTDVQLNMNGQDGKPMNMPFSQVRRLAMRRKTIDRTFDIQALRNCTAIEFLDSGIGVTTASKIEETAQGLVRLSFDIDGWMSDPDGLKVPGPNYKTNLVDGFPFGALIGRVGPTGKRWLAGRHLQQSMAETGRLYFAVNDNGHWQNNIGSFRIHLHATDAYDLGEPQ